MPLISVLAAPLAVALPVTVLADERLKARLARLEDEAAIRELHQNWLRRINTRADDAAGARDATASPYANSEAAAFDQTVRGIATDHSGQPDAIELAADGRSAAGWFHCVVEIRAALAQDSTLARMAHAQGGGFVRRTEHRVLLVEYAKASGIWAIAKVEFASV